MSAERLHNLPAPRTPLIGRARDLAATRALAAEAAGRLLTLVGIGGCGKTSLALQVARELVGAFRDGVWLVELAALTDPTLLPQAVADGVGVREHHDAPILETLLGALRGRDLLLVLDNCEHLVDACAQLVDRLLRDCPRLRVLATSREPLAVAGEIVWQVPSLAVPDPLRLPSLEALADYPAVQLFVERARAVQPDFTLTAHNALSAARVCARLDGIPLALELAAARVRVLPVERIETRLEDSFQVLVGGSRTAPGRQQTLRATLDWSHALLSEGEQLLFCRLAVFSGGFDLDAAEATLADERDAERAGALPETRGGVSGLGRPERIERGEVLELLARLVDKSLVLVEQPGAVERYRLLEPVRQYALERLRASPDGEACRARHAEHFARLAEAGAPELRGPRQAAWLQRLEREHDNLRAALAWSLAAGAPTAVRLAAALHWFWWMRSHFTEGRRWLDRAAAAAAPAPSPARALGTVGLGLHAALQRDYARAEAALLAGAAAARALGECWTAAWASGLLAWVAEHRGAADVAEDRAQEALALSRALGDDWLVAFSLQRLGEAARGREDYALADARLRESLALSRRTEDRFSIANSLNTLGQIAQARGDGPAAAPLLREALALARDIGDKRRSAMALEGLAAVALAAGRPPAAVELLGLAERLREQVGAPREAVDALRFTRHLEEARQALPEEEFAAAWERGRVIPFDDIPADLLEVEMGASAAWQPAPLETRPDRLTPREREVALLLARGLTNRQIADTLVIAEGTARTHVERILAKLGLASRRQVTDWAIAQGLLALRDG